MRKRGLYATNLPFGLIERIREENRETKVPQTRIVESAIEEYLDRKAAERSEAHPAQQR